MNSKRRTSDAGNDEPDFVVEWPETPEEPEAATAVDAQAGPSDQDETENRSLTGPDYSWSMVERAVDRPAEDRDGPSERPTDRHVTLPVDEAAGAETQDRTESATAQGARRSVGRLRLRLASPTSRRQSAGETPGDAASDQVDRLRRRVAELEAELGRAHHGRPGPPSDRAR